jgi:hypothetical protein
MDSRPVLIRPKSRYLRVPRGVSDRTVTIVPTAMMLPCLACCTVENLVLPAILSLLLSVAGTAGLMGSADLMVAGPWRSIEGTPDRLCRLRFAPAS